jgi:hypothetical protein
MSFKQIYTDGVEARTMGRTLRDNPWYQSENLPVSESAAVYRAWQMKAEAWEQGWREQDQLLAPAPNRAPQPMISIDRRAIPLTQRVHESRRTRDADRIRSTAAGVAA